MSQQQDQLEPPPAELPEEVQQRLALAEKDLRALVDEELNKYKGSDDNVDIEAVSHAVRLAAKRVRDELVEKGSTWPEEKWAVYDDVASAMPVESYSMNYAATPFSSLQHLLKQTSVNNQEQLYALALAASQVAYEIRSDLDSPLPPKHYTDLEGQVASFARAVDMHKHVESTLSNPSGPYKAVFNQFQLLSVVCSNPSPAQPVGMAPGVVLVHEATKKVFVSFRGTSTATEWMTDFTAFPTSLNKTEDTAWVPDILDGTRIPQGFHDILRGMLEPKWQFKGDDSKEEEGAVYYELLKKHGVTAEEADVYSPYMKKGLLDLVEEIAKDMPDYDIVFTGHSLGAAIAVLAALSTSERLKKCKPIAVTFACPRVGDEKLVSRIESEVFHVRVYHDGDPVPAVPAEVIPALFNTAGHMDIYTRHGATHHVCVSGYWSRKDAGPTDPNYNSKGSWLSFAHIGFSAALYHPLKCYASAFSFRLPFTGTLFHRREWWPADKPFTEIETSDDHRMDWKPSVETSAKIDNPEVVGHVVSEDAVLEEASSLLRVEHVGSLNNPDPNELIIVMPKHSALMSMVDSQIRAASDKSVEEKLHAVTMYLRDKLNEAEMVVGNMTKLTKAMSEMSGEERDAANDICTYLRPDPRYKGVSRLRRGIRRNVAGLLSDASLCNIEKEHVFTRCLVACNIAYELNTTALPSTNVTNTVDVSTRTLHHALRQFLNLFDQLHTFQSATPCAVRAFDLIGIVCGGKEPPSIEHPLGRSPAVILSHDKSKQVIVAFRGTDSLSEWTDQGHTHLTRPSDAESWCGGAVVEQYLNLSKGHSTRRWEEYNTDPLLSLGASKTEIDLVVPGLQDTLNEVLDNVKEDCKEPLDIIFTGHGQGAAAAVLNAISYAMHNAKKKKTKEEEDVAEKDQRPLVVTFGCPPLGDNEFAESVEKWVRHIRIFHQADPIPCCSPVSPLVPDASPSPADSYGRHGADHHLCVSSYSRVSQGSGTSLSLSPKHKNVDKSRLAVSAALYHSFSTYASSFSFRNSTPAIKRPDWWPLGWDPYQPKPDIPIDQLWCARKWLKK